MWTLGIVCMMTLIHATDSVTLQDLKNMRKYGLATGSFDLGPKEHKLKCIYADIRRKDHRCYVYAQHYEVQGQWYSQLFDAEVRQSRSMPPVLRIKSRDGRTKYDYTLLFWSRREECAIFIVHLPGQMG
ncbi:hypothetical protein MRX96_015469 [Rhipicephalus microplus]